MEYSEAVYIKYEGDQPIITDKLVNNTVVKIVFRCHEWGFGEVDGHGGGYGSGRVHDDTEIHKLFLLAAYYLRENNKQQNKEAYDIFINNIIDQLDAHRYMYRYICVPLL
jgi:hypothetical protein